MKTVKKIIAAALAIATLASLAACAKSYAANSSAGTDEEIGTEAVIGSWICNRGAITLDSNPEAKDAFEKATAGIVGSAYEPIALLGTQVVSGVNYSILCRVTPIVPNAKPDYAVVHVYADLNGSAEITEILILTESGDADRGLLGGLTLNQGEVDPEANDEVKAAFAQATQGLLGCTYEPIAYIGSQMVAGVNYTVLCRTTAITPNALPAFALVTVYMDLQGNATISNVEDMAI